jgi:nicotinic acid mononucleotide adenylyltransferase
MAALAQKLYQNVAWMGGSYAPPTSAHVNVAIAMGEVLLGITDEGKRCAICIVPASKKYDKGSVSEECVPDWQRRALIEEFVAVVKATFAASDNPRKGDLDFNLMPYELDFVDPIKKTPMAVPTYKSMEILKEMNLADKYYIAQGQDNIMDIMRRKWAASPDLLEYELIMYPRGGAPTGEALLRDVIEAMTTDNPGTRAEFKIAEMGAKAYTAEDAEKKFNELIIVPVDFNDDRSSSAVRAILQSPGFTEKSKEEQAAELGPLMDPPVLRVLLSFDPLPYTSPLCEVAPSKRLAAGGAAAGAGSKGGRRRKSKKASKRRSKRRRTRR